MEVSQRFTYFEIQSTLMEPQKYIEDLKEIKEIMHRSSRFLSLSGWSGVSTGIIGLLTAYVAYLIVYNDPAYTSYQRIMLSAEQLTQFLSIAGLAIALAIIIGIYFTTRETKKKKLVIWDYQSKRLLIHLFIPLVAGGLVCLKLLLEGYAGLLPPISLIFYGLGLLNASKYTLEEVRTLGLLNIILGLLSMYAISYGLWLWAVGFGLLHIIFGLVKLKDKS